MVTLLSLCLVKLKKAGYSGLPERNVPYSDYLTSLCQSLTFFLQYTRTEDQCVCAEEGPTQHPLCPGWFPGVLDCFKWLCSSQESHVIFSKYMVLFFKPKPQPPFSECKNKFLSVQSKEWCVIVWQVKGWNFCWDSPGAESI